MRRCSMKWAKRHVDGAPNRGAYHRESTILSGEGVSKRHKRQSWLVATPRFWDGVCGVWGSPWNIIISYNVQEFQMGTLSKAVTFQKYIDLCILNKIPEMMTSILCYVPPSVKLLGPTTLSFQTRCVNASIKALIPSVCFCTVRKIAL